MVQVLKQIKHICIYIIYICIYTKGSKYEIYLTPAEYLKLDIFLETSIRIQKIKVFREQCYCPVALGLCVSKCVGPGSACAHLMNNWNAAALW